MGSNDKQEEERQPFFLSSHHPPRAYYFFNHCYIFLLKCQAGVSAEERERA